MDYHDSIVTVYFALFSTSTHYDMVIYVCMLIDF